VSPDDKGHGGQIEAAFQGLAGPDDVAPVASLGGVRHRYGRSEPGKERHARGGFGEQKHDFGRGFP